jgi:UDP-glucose 4-epimerase
MPIHAGAINDLTSEYYLRLYHQTQGLDFTVLRYPTVYGSRQNVDGAYSIVANLISEMVEAYPVLIEGTGKQELDLIYISDVICANMRVITNGGGQIINLGSGQTISTNQLFEQLKCLTDYPHNATYIPARAGYVRKTLLDTRKAQAMLAWEPRVSLHEGLSLALGDYTNLLSV